MRVCVLVCTCELIHTEISYIYTFIVFAIIIIIITLMMMIEKSITMFPEIKIEIEQNHKLFSTGIAFFFFEHKGSELACVCVCVCTYTHSS